MRIALVVAPAAWLMALAVGLSLASAARAQHELDAETWIEMRKQFRQPGPQPTIDEDVAALAGHDARRAGPRLIDRGPAALPSVHAALLAPEVESRHALHLLQVMRPIRHASSVPVVLELLERDPASPLRRDALLVLAYLPATDAAAAFVRRLAANPEEPWTTRRMAFSWYGMHREARGRPFAEALREDPDPERRAAALYVLARLGDPTALEPVAELLAEGAPSGSREVLLLALAELATPEEFEALAPATLAWSRGYEESLRYARYRTAAVAERTPLCIEMLRAQMPGHQELAVRCLLDAGRADDLRPFAALDIEAPGRAALLRNEIRRAGWHVVDTDEEFRIVPTPPASGSP